MGALAGLWLAVAGCPPAASPTAGVTQLTIGLGYLPSVQFAQFYRAQQQGYYRDAGLEVTFEHRFDYDLIALVGQGTLDLGMADGTSIIPAAGQGIPVRYAATIYARFPNVVLAGTDRGIETPADLRGRKLGIPGRFGSSWVMLQALLASAGLTPEELQIEVFPDFGQAVALRQGRVEAATGFANNEPVQLGLEGFATSVLRVDEVQPLPGPGLTVGAGTLAEKPAALRAFVAATLRAMSEIIESPEAGLDDAIAEVPDLGQSRETQLAILRATIEMWQSPYTAGNGLGAIDEEAWARSTDFMRTLPESDIPTDLTTEALVTGELLP